MPRLTYEVAQAIVAAGIAKGAELGVPMSVAVVDEARELVAFGRADGAALVSIDLDTAIIGSLTLPGEPIFGFQSSDTRFVTFGGGLPLADSDGNVVGAVGASGGPVEIDVQVAEAAAVASGVE